MEINGVRIEETFAEAFPMRATRLIVTADAAEWALAAVTSLTGFATSVIGCGCEAAIERALAPEETPDGRPGYAVLVFAMSRDDLTKHVTRRVGQSVLTAPGSACYSGLDTEEHIPLGATLRYFGDGFQIAKTLTGRRYWRVPVMDGEFLCEDRTGVVKGVGGGNFLILARSRRACAAAATAAVEAIRRERDVILPFPGGVVRSGSKVGSRYKALPASTNHAFCPTLREQVPDSAVPPEVESVLELVLDGLNAEAIARAMRAGIQAVCELGADGGIVAITAGNYGGKLGPFHFHLHEVMAA